MTHLLNVRTALVTAARWWFLEAALKWHFNLTNFTGWYSTWQHRYLPSVPHKHSQKRMHQTGSHDRLFVNAFVCSLEVCVRGFMHMRERLFVCVWECAWAARVRRPVHHKRHPAEQRARSIWPALRKCVCVCVCLCVCVHLSGVSHQLTKLDAFKPLQPKKMSSNTDYKAGRHRKSIHMHNVLQEINIW